MHWENNAVRHNQPGGRIQITTQADGARARLTVETGGRILDAGEIRELAQPFRRLAPDRTGSDNGTGLGLSIVAAIAATHHGTLDLYARPEGGLGVIIELPAGAVSQGVRRARSAHAGRSRLPQRREPPRASMG
jgi:signal transduction histidine kinase